MATTPAPKQDTEYRSLRLSFHPDAIRDHFEGDPEVENILDTMTDEEVAKIGEAALWDDRLYQTFHRVLVDAFTEVTQEKGEQP